MITCKECGKEYKRNCDLVRHINAHHDGLKIYYDQYLKEDSEGYCEICGNETEFIRFDRGYRRYCSEECRKKGRVDKIENTSQNKYGVKNVNKLKMTRDKIRKTNISKYGNACPMQEDMRQRKIQKENLKNLGVTLPFYSQDIQDEIKKQRKKKYGVEYNFQSPIFQEKARQTNLERYGFKYPLKNEDIKKKLRETNLKKYGKEYVSQVKEIQDKVKNTVLSKYGKINVSQINFVKEKVKQTNLRKYGVEYPLQNRKIFEKHEGNRFKRKKFRDTNIHYQGSYEYDFLEKYISKFPDIQNGPTIRYKYNGKWKTYYPDFYIPSLNLIVEIKGSYFIDDKIEYKRKACEDMGYKFLMIVDKNYSLI